MSEVDDLDPRERRAREEDMDVSLLKKGGVYEVRSESGNTYKVDIAGGVCTCLDWQQREPDGGCKHLRRVDAEIKAGDVPRPDGRVPSAVSYSISTRASGTVAPQNGQFPSDVWRVCMVLKGRGPIHGADSMPLEDVPVLTLIQNDVI